MNIGSDRCPPYSLPPIEEKSEEDSRDVSSWESIEISESSESEFEQEEEIKKKQAFPLKYTISNQKIEPSLQRTNAFRYKPPVQ